MIRALPPWLVRRANARASFALFVAVLVAFTLVEEARPEVLRIADVSLVPLTADGLVLEGVGAIPQDNPEWQMPPGIWDDGFHGTSIELDLYWQDQRAVLTVAPTSDVRPDTATLPYAPSQHRRLTFVDQRVDAFVVSLWEYGPNPQLPSGHQGVPYRLRCVVRRAEPEPAEEIDPAELALGKWMRAPSPSTAPDASDASQRQQEHWWLLGRSRGREARRAEGRFPNMVLFVAVEPTPGEADPQDLARYDLRIYDAVETNERVLLPRLRKTSLRGPQPIAGRSECVIAVEDTGWLGDPSENPSGRRLLVRVRQTEGPQNGYRIHANLFDVVQGADSAQRSGLLAERRHYELETLADLKQWRRRTIGGGQWRARRHYVRPPYPGTLYVSSGISSRKKGVTYTGKAAVDIQEVGASLPGSGLIRASDGMWTRDVDAGDWSNEIVLEVSARRGRARYYLTSLVVPRWPPVTGRPHTDGSLAYGDRRQTLATWTPSAGPRELRVATQGNDGEVDIEVFSRESGATAWGFETRASTSPMKVDGDTGTTYYRSARYAALPDYEYAGLLSLNSRAQGAVQFTLTEGAWQQKQGPTELARGRVRIAPAQSTWRLAEDGPAAVTLHVQTAGGTLAGRAPDIEILRDGEKIEPRHRLLGSTSQYVLDVPSGGGAYSIHLRDDREALLYYTQQPYVARPRVAAANGRPDRAESVRMPRWSKMTLQGALTGDNDDADVWRVSSDPGMTSASVKISVGEGEGDPLFLEVYNALGDLTHRLGTTPEEPMPVATQRVMYLVVVWAGARAGRRATYAIDVSDPQSRPPGDATPAPTPSTFVESLADLE
ncbi:hypothetical protein HN371_30080 [Candidatus Poribacteria bacterium]|jgi:hypothetical protein|nr:hypothetical protein [Candidatus Poribacteria bacterium]MBT7805025.1 hypothetical protein [Candidatus Poribacteria bacterium]